MSFYFRFIAGAAGFVTAVLWGAVSFLLGRDRARLPSAVARRIGRLVCPPAGIRLRVTGIERLAAAQPCVYVANHQSYLDYAILGSIYPERTVVLGRADLGSMPLIGWLYRATGNLLVDREDPASRRAALDALADALGAGRSVWVFPEGTRNAASGTLLPFRRGAFHVAATMRVPIVPIVVEPLAPHTDLRARRLRRRVLDVRVLAPVPSAGRDAHALLVDVRARMQRTLDALGEHPEPHRAVRAAR